MTDPRTDLEDLIEAAEKIERFTDGMTYEEFLEDEKTVDAVLRFHEHVKMCSSACAILMYDWREVMK